MTGKSLNYWRVSRKKGTQSIGYYSAVHEKFLEPPVVKSGIFTAEIYLEIMS